MTNESRDIEDAAGAIDPRRREFIARSIAAGVAVAAGSALAAESVVETDVTITTRDGSCDAAFFHPAAASHPGVLIWPDAFGLRPAMRSMARRLAADGYAVLVPNVFYRISRAPQFASAANIDFREQAVMTKLRPLMESVDAAGAAESDALAYIAFLDRQPQTDRTKKIGTQGYCMGGALTLRTAAAHPDRVGAGASFHGGRLVTDAQDSPHRLAPKMKARMYIAIASNDDQRQPDAKAALTDAFAKANVPAEVEVYPAQHGWCVPDMPVENGAPIYSMPEAERAWSKLLTLYKTALA
jgi:carboxymethylenebutenolidase